MNEWHSILRTHRKWQCNFSYMCLNTDRFWIIGSLCLENVTLLRCYLKRHVSLAVFSPFLLWYGSNSYIHITLCDILCRHCMTQSFQSLHVWLNHLGINGQYVSPSLCVAIFNRECLPHLNLHEVSYIIVLIVIARRSNNAAICAYHLACLQAWHDNL